MIRLVLDRKLGNGQRGGIAMLTALGFLLFSIPIITASLGLAQTTSIDARVKTGVTERHYCGLAVQEYFDYLLSDGKRWNIWLVDNPDPSDPTGDTSTQTLDLCGQNITITVTQQADPPPDPLTDPLGDPSINIPDDPAYDQRDFQVLKTVSNPNPVQPESVTYTITVVNRDATPTNLNKIRDSLPPGFSYDCAAPAPDKLTLPGLPSQNIVPSAGPCPAGTDIDWDLPPSTSIESGGVVTLTFTAVPNWTTGSYCNEAQITPGGNKTTSGKTAFVQIGFGPTICPGEAVLVTKVVDNVALLSTDATVDPKTYTYHIDYAVKVDNIGTTDLTIAGFIDLLPEGFSYLSILPGDISNPPTQITLDGSLNRERVTWNLTPEIPLASGTAAKTLAYRTIAVISRGNYYTDHLTQFSGGSFPDDVYTWPTARITIIELYDITATDANGNTIALLQVSVESDFGVIDTWDIR